MGHVIFEGITSSSAAESQGKGRTVNAVCVTSSRAEHLQQLPAVTWAIMKGG